MTVSPPSGMAVAASGGLWRCLCESARQCQTPPNPHAWRYLCRIISEPSSDSVSTLHPLPIDQPQRTATGGPVWSVSSPSRASDHRGRARCWRGRSCGAADVLMLASSAPHAATPQPRTGIAAAWMRQVLVSLGLSSLFRTPATSPPHADTTPTGGLGRLRSGQRSPRQSGE